MNSNVEDFLPHDLQFAPAVRMYEEEIHDWFTAQQEANGDIIDLETELERDFEKFYLLCEVIVSLSYDNLPQEEARGATGALYRGMLFGMEISESAGVMVVKSLPMKEYFEDCIDMPTEQLVKDVSDYLSKRPEIDDLISYYSPELDRSGRWGHFCEIGAGFTLMLCERMAGELYMESMISAANPEDIS